MHEFITQLNNQERYCFSIIKLIINLTQAETESIREKIKIPIAVLKSGETRHCRLELDFPDSPVTFKLIEGNGPVYIVGQHLVEEYGDMEEIEEEFMDEEDMVFH